MKKMTSICEGAMETRAGGKEVSMETKNLGKNYFLDRYQDILQGDFFEDYFLLAYKSLTWMLWSKTKCGKVNTYTHVKIGFPTFSGSLDCENRRRHDQQHLEAWCSC